MTDADVHRSTPGYVYGVAIRSSRQEEGTPPCSCPCHLADSPRGARGWYCDRCYAYLAHCSYPEQEPVAYSHEQAISDGRTNPRTYMVMVPDYYFITKGNSLDDAFPRRHFKTKEAAKKAAAKLNDDDAIASLKVPRTHRQRFDRFRELQGGRCDWGIYGDAHPLTNLPRKPGRYAVAESHDGDSWWTT